jgi:hypothetical protein
MVAGAGGLFLGMVSTPDPGPLGAMIITIAGTFVGANLAFFYTSGGIGWLRDRFDKPWALIGLTNNCRLDRGNFLLDACAEPRLMSGLFLPCSASVSVPAA